MKNRNIYIIAGPNGSGKTTFAKEFLPDYAKCPNFINADLIAGGLSPFSPQTVAIKSGRIVLSQIHDFAAKGADFAFETTLSGKSYINLFHKMKDRNYKLHLFFLWIPTADFAIARIKDRVAEGGHDVPANDVRRRFYHGIYNFFKYYKSIADSWTLFDNSGTMPNIIAKGKNGHLEIFKDDVFNNIIKIAGVK